MSKTHATADAATEAAPPSKRSLVARLKIPAIILAIVAVEWIAAYLYLPGADAKQPASSDLEDEAEAEPEPQEEEHDQHGGDHGHEPAAEAAPAEEHGSSHKEEKGHGGEHGAPEAVSRVRHGEFEEVDLGEYSVTAYQHVSSSTQFISFHLYGTIRHKHAQEFRERFEDSKHRVRDNVIVIVRSAEITDLTDAGLGLIKRRILETTNKRLGKPLLQGVVFSDFSFIEQ